MLRRLSTSAASARGQVRVVDYVADVLVRQGVKNVFGGHGGAVIPLVGSIASHPGLNWVYMRNEQAASLAAAADAKLTGRLAVCVATSGPGASHLTTGLVDALQVRASDRARRPHRAFSCGTDAQRWRLCAACARGARVLGTAAAAPDTSPVPYPCLPRARGLPCPCLHLRAQCPCGGAGPLPRACDHWHQVYQLGRPLRVPDGAVVAKRNGRQPHPC